MHASVGHLRCVQVVGWRSEEGLLRLRGYRCPLRIVAALLVDQLANVHHLPLRCARWAQDLPAVPAVREGRLTVGENVGARARKILLAKIDLVLYELQILLYLIRWGGMM